MPLLNMAAAIVASPLVWVPYPPVSVLQELVRLHEVRGEAIQWLLLIVIQRPLAGLDVAGLARGSCTHTTLIPVHDFNRISLVFFRMGNQSGTMVNLKLNIPSETNRYN